MTAPMIAEQILHFKLFGGVQRPQQARQNKIQNSHRQKKNEMSQKVNLTTSYACLGHYLIWIYIVIWVKSAV
jgi:hypothetical protein